MIADRKIIIEFLHLFALVGFAIAQPVYDMLGKYPEFFVAHAAKPALIINMILVLSFGLALVLVLGELAARLFGERVRCGVHWLFVFVLAVVIALPLMKRMTASDFLIVGSAVLFGLLFTVLYARLPLVRMFMTVLSPVTLIFPLWFVMATPVDRLVMPPKNQAHAEIQIKNPVTIIVLVFDEFGTTALLDAERRIDPVRFPNFATLAAESLWFPNAISASQSTVESIPSIVTGLNPRPDAKLLPTAIDYPANLFTILGGKYALDVFETDTALCPQELCAKQNNKLGQNYVSFFSDILVIYSHVIIPPGRAKKLPSLEARWTGFGDNLMGTLPAKKDGALTPGLSKKEIKRDNHLAQFLSQIKASSVPKLYFIHTILPHIPYCYLASGQQYSEEQKLPEGIVSDKIGWLGEKPLIITAYNRYLQQVGYVDNFLGRLRSKLISEGIYDDSLLILTADHGVAFEQLQSRRLMTGVNNSEIFKVPMFVKLPKQNYGRIDESIVSGIDVLPTIIDVLEANVTWQLDGLSVATDQGSSRDGIDFVGLGHLGADDIVGFPRLEWQIEHFGAHTPLDRLVPKGPFNELAGRDVAGLQIGRAVDMLLISNVLGHFKYVNLESHFLPSLFRGYIKGADERNLPLAIAVNGQIWATTNTSEWDGRKNYFSVLFPTAALQQGQNIINVYLIEQSGEGLLLRPINENKKDLKLQQRLSGLDSLLFADGREVSVDTGRNNMDGYLDWLTLKDDMLVFEGWAVDLVESEPASDILIFQGEKLVWQVAPTYIRDGVAKVFDRPTLARSGYRAIVPLRVLESHSGDISVVAMSQDKRAFRIHIKEIHKELIRTTLAK